MGSVAQGIAWATSAVSLPRAHGKIAQDAQMNLCAQSAWMYLLGFLTRVARRQQDKHVAQMGSAVQGIA